jgi:cobalt-zinc-cadmium efflux system membrane fusion protein
VTSRVRAVSALLACVLAGSGCAREASDEVVSTSAVPVSVATATMGTVRATIHVTGTVAPAPGAELVVIAPEAARIAEIPGAEGDRVRRGDLLVRFEIPSMTADVESRRGDVVRARARIEAARSARTRAHELFDRGVAARRDVEDADRELADAEAALAQAAASESAAETVARRETVHATFDGVIATRAHNPGDLVEPSSSDPVLRVIDPARLGVEASVPLADVARVIVGARARLVDAPGGPAELRVASRAVAVDPATGAAPVRLTFDRPTMLPAGTPVQLEIDGEEHTNVVLLPASAIVREEGGAAVYLADGGKAARRDVSIGASDGAQVEIRHGVKAGDRVIAPAQAGLPDGAAITVAPPAR